DTIIVYDGAGLYSAPRVWWTFRLFGAHKVFILDGGLPKWKAEGRTLEAGPVARPPRTFSPRKAADLLPSLAPLPPALPSRPRPPRAASGGARTPLWSPRPPPGAQPWRAARHRGWMRAPPSAFWDKRRSRAPACAPGTCQAP